jgi:hypothetical protein
MSKQAKRQLAGSGETLPAGAVGEVISTDITTTTTKTAIFSTVDISGASLTLTPGVWRIEAHGFTVFTCTSSNTGTRVVVQVQLTTSSNTYVAHCNGATIETGLVTRDTKHVYLSAIVNISTSTTYKLRLTDFGWVGTEVINTPSIDFYATAPNERRAFFRAIRIA